MTVIPGVYKDLAPRQPRTPGSFEICTIHGVATHETNDDKRVIIERTCVSGSPKYEHLTLEEFGVHIDVNGHKTPRFVFIHPNHFQD